jgi:hypothetical protein
VGVSTVEFGWGVVVMESARGDVCGCVDVVCEMGVVVVVLDSMLVM